MPRWQSSTASHAPSFLSRRGRGQRNPESSRLLQRICKLSGPVASMVISACTVFVNEFKDKPLCRPA